MPHLEELNNINQGIKIGLKQNLYIAHSPAWFEEKLKYEYTVWSIASGNIYMKISGKSYSASAGDVVLFSPGIVCAAHSDSGGCEFSFQQFSIELGNNLNLLSKINLPGIIEKKYIGAECLSFCRNMKEKSNLSLKAYAEFFMYISKVLELVSEEKHTPFFTGLTNLQKNDLWRAATYISENFRYDISIKDTAARMGFSEKYFIQQFKKILGISPKRYITQCRMRYASHMLIHSDEKIQDIALQLGYADVYSFTKAFKKYYNESPSEFRKNIIY